MSSTDDAYGERVVSWLNVWNRLYPEDGGDPHDDEAAAEINRLRGLATAQAAETECVLGKILRILDPGAKIDIPGGQLLRAIQGELNEAAAAVHANDLGLVDKAIKRRNRVVHDAVTIGSSWAPYATGGGEWVPVISFLGNAESDEQHLRQDLIRQQQATIAAVRILHEVWTRDVESS